MEVDAQLSLHFLDWKCVTRKNNRWIALAPFNQISARFHKSGRTVSRHLFLVTDYLEKVGQGPHLPKKHNFDSEIFMKNSQRQLSRMVTGNTKIHWNPNLSASRPRTSILVSINFAPFFTFSRRVENKKYLESLRLLNIFNNILQIIIGTLELYIKMCNGTVVAAQTSSFFSRWKWVVLKKRWKYRISLSSSNRFVVFSSPFRLGNNGPLNKNWRDDLDIIDWGRSNGNVSQVWL